MLNFEKKQKEYWTTNWEIKRENNKKERRFTKDIRKKKTEKGNQKTDNIEEFINEKIASTENGIIYMNDKDMKSIMKAAKQNKQQNSFTANTMLNLKI